MPGSFDLGADSLGDGLDAPTPSPARTAPAAILFDVTTRQHVLNEDGTFEYLHPVDAAVVNALFIARGRLSSSPTTGARFREIRSAYDPRARATAEDMVRQALKSLTDSGDVTIVAISYEAAGENRPEIGVDYYNNRVLPRELQRR